MAGVGVIAPSMEDVGSGMAKACEMEESFEDGTGVVETGCE
jgi:hypothetical protein